MSSNPFGNSILDQNAGLNSVPSWMNGSGSTTAASSTESASLTATDILAAIMGGTGTTQTTQSSPSVQDILSGITPEQVIPAASSSLADLIRSKDNKFGTISYISRPSPGGYSKW